MMNKKNLGYILLIILAVAFYYYQREDSPAMELSAVDLSTQPIYQSEQMLTTIYDPLGKLSYKITAKAVQHFEDTGNTLFQSPDITLYNQDNTPTWHIKANHATLTHDKLLLLNEKVQLEDLQPAAQLQKILTENAKIDLTTQVVTSEDLVTMQGAYFTSTGTGLLGNLRNKTADILENVKTNYNASTIQTNSVTD